MKKLPKEYLFFFLVIGAISYLLLDNGLRHYYKSQAVEEHPSMDKIQLTEAEWRSRLNPEEYRILREQGTEPAFCGQYWNTKDKGTYLCRACGLPLFTSAAKFDSGTGWPSFFQPIDAKRILLKNDTSHNLKRTEVVCARCNSHLGHVFDDGPPPSGKRFCINSMALEFVKDKVK